MSHSHLRSASDTAARPGPVTALLAAVIVFYVIFSYFNLAPLEEDAYIYFRFAENIAAGHGYVFNPGGEHIEGCSSITWLFLLAAIKLLGLDLLYAVKPLGILFGCCSLVLIYTITARITAPERMAVLPCLLTAISVPFLMRNQMGMEEPLYTFAFLLLIFVCIRPQLFKYWPVALFLVVISRPEGLFLSLGMLPVFYYRRDQHKNIIVGLAILFALTAVLFLIRLLYFHDFLPSPFYHKVYPGKYRESIGYMLGFLKDYYMYVFLAPLALLMFRKKTWSTEKNIIAGFAGVHCLWVLLAGACFFPFYRHMVPVIPLFTVLVYAIVAEADFLKPTVRNWICICFFSLYGAAALLLPTANWTPWKGGPNFIADNIRRFAVNPAAYMSNLIEKIREPRFDREYPVDMQSLTGCFIKNNYLPGTSFVYDQMGRLPYHAGPAYSFRDSGYLIDQEMAHCVFSVDSRTSSILHAYDRISQFLIKEFFPETRFYSSPAEITDAILADRPDVLMCCVLIRNMIIDAFAKNPILKQKYVPTYFMHGILFLERRGLQKKAFNNSGNLQIYYKDEIYRQVQNHPWLARSSSSGK